MPFIENTVAIELGNVAICLKHKVNSDYINPMICYTLTLKEGHSNKSLNCENKTEMNDVFSHQVSSEYV
jgi:hypothetical protein